MKEFFEVRRFVGTINITMSNGEKWVKDKLILCKEILDIVKTYSKAGYVMTLRQLYYRLVAANAIRNDDKVYSKISAVLYDLRISGQLDWDAIEDRGRKPSLPYCVEDIKDALTDTISHYRLNRQEGQPNYLELWAEKDAISGILNRISRKYHINLVINKGYSSHSAMHDAYKRFVPYIKEGKGVYILYLGDHDPSGKDMLRDIRERILFMLSASEHHRDYLPNLSDINEFVDNPEDWDFVDWYAYHNEISYETLYWNGECIDKDTYDFFDNGGNEDSPKWHKYQDAYYLGIRKLYWATRVRVIPVALTMKQIKKYNPPQNPTKLKDTRSEEYVRQFGNFCWEVDALPPDIMTEITEEAILKYLDLQQYNLMLDKEKNDIASIKKIIDSFDYDNINNEKDEDTDDDDDMHDDNYLTGYY